MARELSRVFRIFVTLNFSFHISTGTANVAKRRPFFVFPVLAHFGRFGGISRQNGPTDHLYAKRALNRKSRENKVVRDFRTTKDDYLTAGNKTLKNYKNIFGN